jgi:hypothetical protein
MPHSPDSDPNDFSEFFRSMGGDLPDSEELEKLLGRESGPGWDQQVVAELYRTLGDVPRTCEECGGLCGHHVVRIRDAFMKRAANILIEMSKGVAIYHLQREWGIQQPSETVQKIYDLWQQLFILYPLAEPQESLEDEDDFPDAEGTPDVE